MSSLAQVLMSGTERAKLPPTELKGELKEAIESAFGSVEDFKKEFSAAGATQFGSGWAWLVVDGGKLAITKSPNAENPIVSGQTPILTMDVWEHAYYLGAQLQPVAMSVCLTPVAVIYAPWASRTQVATLS